MNLSICLNLKLRLSSMRKNLASGGAQAPSTPGPYATGLAESFVSRDPKDAVNAPSDSLSPLFSGDASA
jgi:hypothetical protein